METNPSIAKIRYNGGVKGLKTVIFRPPKPNKIKLYELTPEYTIKINFPSICASEVSGLNQFSTVMLMLMEKLEPLDVIDKLIYFNHLKYCNLKTKQQFNFLSKVAIFLIWMSKILS